MSGSKSNPPTSYSVSVAELDDWRTWAEAQTLIDVQDIFENSETDADQSNPLQIVLWKKCKVYSANRGSRNSKKNT